MCIYQKYEEPTFIKAWKKTNREEDAKKELKSAFCSRFPHFYRIREKENTKVKKGEGGTAKAKKLKIIKQKSVR